MPSTLTNTISAQSLRGQSVRIKGDSSSGNIIGKIELYVPGTVVIATTGGGGDENIYGIVTANNPLDCSVTIEPLQPNFTFSSPQKGLFLAGQDIDIYNP